MIKFIGASWMRMSRRPRDRRPSRRRRRRRWSRRGPSPPRSPYDIKHYNYYLNSSRMAPGVEAMLFPLRGFIIIIINTFFVLSSIFPLVLLFDSLWFCPRRAAASSLRPRVGALQSPGFSLGLPSRLPPPSNPCGLAEPEMVYC